MASSGDDQQRAEIDVIERAPRPPKVFGIGLHKTSTTSLANALYILGYDVTGYFDTSAFADQAAIERHVIATAGRHDAAQDVPWSEFYQLLDETYPGSKFVLTVRDPDRWLASVVNHFKDLPIATHSYIYGVPNAIDHQDVYRDHFVAHTERVEAHFAGRPDDLLVMDISAGDGWEALCPFLDQPVPPFGFPRQNAAPSRATRIRRRVGNRVTATWSRYAPARVVPPEPVPGRVAYSAVHLLCRRIDGVLAVRRHLSGPVANQVDRELTGWLASHADWQRLVGADDGRATTVRPDLDPDQIESVWSELQLRTRRWAADLTDDAVRSRLPSGGTVGAALRLGLAEADSSFGRVAAALGAIGLDAGPSGGVEELARAHRGL